MNMNEMHISIILQNFQLEKVEPAKCAFDKPSKAFLDFLARHYGLERPIWQPTSFVIFAQFFDGLQPEDGANKHDEESEPGRPLTALERNRRSINERYNGKNPPSMSSSTSPVSKNILLIRFSLLLIFIASGTT
jgi:hypothetical protein